MFTGIIEEMGIIDAIQKSSISSSLQIKAKIITADLNIGDSVAVNGVCLTVTTFTDNFFSADVMNETLDRSNLGSLTQGSNVNLERAMLANGRFGGHIVSGHIDGTGQITSIKNDDNAVWYTIKTTPKIINYIIEKGSITIDGISLTVADVSHCQFSVSVISHTRNVTTLSQKKVGSTVNLENDIIGKYIEKFISNNDAIKPESKLTKDFLLKAGF